MNVFEWRDSPEGPQYAVLGDPIAHSKSPAIHSAAMAVAGISGEYIAIRVEEHEFGEALERLRRCGYLGINITAPLKEIAFQACAEWDRSAETVRAVNTINLPMRKGWSTDAQGFFAAVEKYGKNDGNLLVLGTGGTARTILSSENKSKFEKFVWGRNVEAASELASVSGVTLVRDPDTSGYDVVVNATSASLHGTELPMIWGGQGLAMDTWYGDQPSAWMLQARAHGWRAVDGKEMLIQQAAIAFKIFHGVNADLEVMREAMDW